MPVAKIECPQCHGRFTLKTPSLEAMAPKIFRCPKCGHSATFGRLLGPDARVTAQMHTHIAKGAATQDGKTHVSTRSNLASLTVESTGRTFPLGQGTYTLGRDSSDSRSTLRIAPDRYMSRLQANLEVMALPNGVRCRISSANDLNPVIVNSTKLAQGQSLDLRNGDRILLGSTYVSIKM